MVAAKQLLLPLAAATHANENHFFSAEASSARSREEVLGYKATLARTH